MKIAVSAQGKGLDSALDPRFGRAAGFVVVDTDTGAWDFVENGQNMALAQGAGLQAAQNVAGSGARAVITGHVGPKAFLALSRGRISVHLAAGEMSVARALELYKDGKLPAADGADRDGHW